MLNGNFIKGLLIKLRSWLFVNASGASGPLHNRDRARFGCILGEIGAFGPRRPWLASPAMRLLGPHAPISPRMHPKRALVSLNYTLFFFCFFFLNWVSDAKSIYYQTGSRRTHRLQTCTLRHLPHAGLD